MSLPPMDETAETPEIPETPASFHEEDLSAEDLAVLREFDAMEDIFLDEAPHNVGTNLSAISSRPESAAQVESEEVSPEDMLLLFISEVEEDVSVLRNGVQQLKSSERPDVVRLQLLERKAHKIKGTAGTFGSNAFASIARYTETLIHLLVQGSLRPQPGLNILTSAISALEATLTSLVTMGEESGVPLEELEAEFKARKMDISGGTFKYIPEEDADSINWSQQGAEEAVDVKEPEDDPLSVRVDMAMAHFDQLLLQGGQRAESPSVHVDVGRFEQLLLHSEQLTDLQMLLSNAQQQVESSLQELHTAQARLLRLEFLCSTLPLFAKVSGRDRFIESAFDRQVQTDDYQFFPSTTQSRQRDLLRWDAGRERPASSMIASILDEANVRLGRDYKRKGRRQTRRFFMQQSLYGDELEMDSYTETDTLKNRLSEAIADVATASAQVRTAFARLNNVLQKQMASAQHVRRDALSLRLTPLRALLARIERVVMMNDRAQPGRIHFEVQGETVEIDQHILEELKTPLLHLARTCVTPSLQSEEHVGRDELDGSEFDGDKLRPDRGRVWFYAQAVGNEVAIEIGTSLLVEGGAVDEVQDTIRRLHGSIFVQRNAAGGISFHLRLPRSQGSTWGLLVQAGQQRVMVPFAQIQRIEYGSEGLESYPARTSSSHIGGMKKAAQEECIEGEADPIKRSLPVYSLSNLLRMSAEILPTSHMRPVLLLHPVSTGLRVQVDAVIGDVEQVISPLAPYLRSPGIIGTAIDNIGNTSDASDVLLVVNLPELIRYTAGRQSVLHSGSEAMDVAHTLTDYHLSPAEGADRVSTPQQKVVLVADDSISIRKSLLQTLSAGGYRAVGVKDGIEALEYLLDHATPHVLLLDVEMPNLNGYDLLSIIRAHPQLATVKIVMLTSRSSEKHERRALELGAHAYLTKPCPQDVLLSTIQSLPM